MSTREAAMIAIFAGIVVAGIVWFALGMVGNLRHMLARRAKGKSGPGKPAPGDDK